MLCLDGPVSRQMRVQLYRESHSTNRATAASSMLPCATFFLYRVADTIMTVDAGKSTLGGAILYATGVRVIHTNDLVALTSSYSKSTRGPWRRTSVKQRRWVVRLGTCRGLSTLLRYKLDHCVVIAVLLTSI